MKRTILFFLSLISLTAEAQEATADYISFAKAYGIMRYHSPNHHTEKWDEIDWFKIGYYYADKIGENTAEDVIKEMAAVFAPDAFMTSKPENRKSRVSTAEISSYQYRLHTGGGSISVQGYSPYYKEIIICSSDMPEYAPETGRWYSYRLSDNLYLNMQSAARSDSFSKDGTEKVLKEAEESWDALYDEGGDYMSEVIGIFNDRTYRITDLMIRWNMIQHFYPYHKEDGLDWESQLPVMIGKAISEEFDKKDRNTVFAYWDMLKEVYSPVKDAHLDIDGALSFPGLPERYLTKCYLPIALTCLEDCIIIDGSEMDIEKGSRLKAISGIDIEDLIKEKSMTVSQTNKSAERLMSLYEAISAFDRDSVMTVGYITPEGVEKTVSSKPSYYKPMSTRTTKPVFEIKDRCMIVNLCEREAFDDGFYGSFMKMYADTAPEAIIFDIRGYPTYHFDRILPHLTDKELSNAFFKVMKIALPDQKNAGYSKDESIIRPKAPHIDIPCYYLTDYRAMSWAETVLMLVKEYDLGKIIGTPTCGTNGDVTQFRFPAFSVMTTGLHASNIDGSQHHGIGVQPDIWVEISADDHINGKDVIMARALNMTGQTTNSILNK